MPSTRGRQGNIYPQGVRPNLLRPRLVGSLPGPRAALSGPTCGHRAQVTSVTKVSRMRRSIISASGARLRVRGVFGLRGLQKSTAAFAASCRTRGAFAPASCFLGAAPCCQGASRYTRGGTRGQTRRHESGTNAEPGMAAPAPAPSGMSLVARISRVMLLSVIWCGR